MAKTSLNTVIAIDGPAGAGKSTVAKRLAETLHYAYLDTGAMYRALTLKAMQQNTELEDEDALVALAKETTIDLAEQNGTLQVLLDGYDVSEAIRTVEVTNNTFYIARAPRVREIMVGWQREIGGRKNVIVEGRDTTTVVFPKASYKFFLDAKLDERSNRRLKEYKEKGKEVDADKLKNELKERDHKDCTRKAGALIQADDAVYIDTTGMNVEEVVGEMLKHIRS